MILEGIFLVQSRIFKLYLSYCIILWVPYWILIIFLVESNQAWVTVASSDQEAFQALILAKSLTQTLTNRKILIWITEDVTRDMK